MFRSMTIAEVSSQTRKDKKYVIRQNGHEFSCSCPAWHFSAVGVCKHMKQLAKKVRAAEVVPIVWTKESMTEFIQTAESEVLRTIVWGIVKAEAPNWKDLEPLACATWTPMDLFVARKLLIASFLVHIVEVANAQEHVRLEAAGELADAIDKVEGI